MNRIYNGMRATDLGSEGWHKPWSGGNGGNCVEAMRLDDGRVAVRQSTDPDGPALIYSSGEIAAFVRGAKAGKADFLFLGRTDGRCPTGTAGGTDPHAGPDPVPIDT